MKKLYFSTEEDINFFKRIAWAPIMIMGWVLIFFSDNNPIMLYLGGLSQFIAGLLSSTKEREHKDTHIVNGERVK
jgi:hypothetical protein